MSLGSVEALLKQPPQAEARRIEALREELASLEKTWRSSPESPGLEQIAEKIGYASRETLWRIPLGASGFLDFFCRLVCAEDLRTPLKIQALRVIGNSCVDLDQNRELVVNSACLSHIVNSLDDVSVLDFVIPVLYNICVDYEPAQEIIFEAGVNPRLIELLSGQHLEHVERFTDIICKLLGFVASRDPKPDLMHPATPFVLLDLSLKTDPQSPEHVENFLGLSTVAFIYLTRRELQEPFLDTPGSINLVLQNFSRACEEIDESQIDEEEQEGLKKVQDVFPRWLADLSAHPLFVSACLLDGPEVRTLQRWLSTPHLPLQTTGCLVLGNLARSDESCVYLIEHAAVHRPLAAIISNPANEDMQLLHAVLSFLKNLAIPASNKPVLGDAGLLEDNVLPRMWELYHQPQVQFAAVSLTRLLLVNCPANVGRICSPPRTDSDPDASSPSGHRTSSKLQKLLDLYKRSEDGEPKKMEVARAVLTVCRVLHTNPISSLAPDTSSSAQITSRTPATVAAAAAPIQDRGSSPATEGKSPLKEFYDNHPAIASTLPYLGIQDKFPTLRSELLFVFAIMARTSEDAEVVARCMSLQPALVPIIAEVVTGERMSDRDREEILGRVSEADKDEDSTSPVQSTEKTDQTLPSDPDLDIDLSRLDLASLEPHLPGVPGMPPPAAVASTSSASEETATSAAPRPHNVDRENGLILIAELLRRSPGESLVPKIKHFLIRILETGGERLIREREGEVTGKEKTKAGSRERGEAGLGEGS